MMMHRSVCGMLWLSGGLCFLIKMLVGVQVDAQGLMHEPFFLLPLGYVLLLLGFISTIILIVQRWSQRRHTKN